LACLALREPSAILIDHRGFLSGNGKQSVKNSLR
jgi:hypothetical protein